MMRKKGSLILLKLGTLKLHVKLIFLNFENCDVTIFNYEKIDFCVENSGILVQNHKRWEAFFWENFYLGFPFNIFVGILIYPQSLIRFFMKLKINWRRLNVTFILNLVFRMYCGHSSVRREFIFKLEYLPYFVCSERPRNEGFLNV